MVNPTTIRKNFLNRLKCVPKSSGVYFFKDITGTVIYVGKAKNLQNRVSSYFGKKSYDSRIKHLKQNIHDFDINITQTPNDALILESYLIKKYQPKYNIRLKDDKSYPYIVINTQDDYPKIQYTRNIKSETERKSKIFGPFSKAKEVRRTIDVLNKLFPYCTTHVQRCSDNCENAVNKNEYNAIIMQIINFLEGDHKLVIDKLNNEMLTASNNKMYERAGRIRDQIESINEFFKLSHPKSSSNRKIDYIGFTLSDDIASFQLFESRYTNINNTFKFIMEGVRSRTNTDVLDAFINQYYFQKHDKPEIVVVSIYPNIKEINTDVLKLKNKIMKFVVPKIGEKKRILDLAINNAQFNLEHIKRAENDISNTLKTLKTKLELKTMPKRIECYDISNIQGTNPVGSMVVFINGLPKKSEYRRYKIKTVNQVYDYEMMTEMLQRRLQKLNINEPNNIPDLILIDGGKGHLSSAYKVLLNSNFPKIPIASLAKKHEYVYLPNSSEPVDIESLSNEAILLQQLRDEAHRFAIQFHRNLRSKMSLDHPLENIDGIGPVILKNLLIKYKTVKNIKMSKHDDLIKIKGINSNLAKKILSELNK